MNAQDLKSAFWHQRILPVLRERDAGAAAARVGWLLAAGARVVELTTTTRDWHEALSASLRDARTEEPLIGVGTVTTADVAAKAVEHGAAFLVSPFPSPAVRGVATEAGIPFIEGGFTPAEVAAAAAHGMAKVFPAHVGGPAYIKSLRAVLPKADLIPTGGINLADVDDYRLAGAMAVGIGSELPTDPVELAAVFRW
jgi:2-dehydro-3-deoxyphosphogluconate aldolase/(4S)-4-hydroxy-2-oxoglutarate aldolase